MMSSNGSESLSEKLPEELMSKIFSYLTVVELARIQRTCKRWYDIAQQNSTLWKDSIPFFSHLQNLRTPKSSGEINKQKAIKQRSDINLYGFYKLQELSKHRLDGIMIRNGKKSVWSDSLCAAIIKALEEHPPTKLSLQHCGSSIDTKRDSHCLELLAKNESLKHLDLCFCDYYNFWSLELSCSLESLNLDCPSLSNCRSKESLIEALKSVKKMKLRLPLKRPENMEFLEKVGQNLEVLEFEEEEEKYVDYDYDEGDEEDEGEDNEDERQVDQADVGERTMMCFPKLIELTITSTSRFLSRSYQLICPQLQSLKITVNPAESIADSQDKSIYFELLAKTQLLKHLCLTIEQDEFDFWNLELFCSLESLKLECPSLSRCRSKESMIKAFKNIKKIELDLPLERPGNLVFLGKVGQNLEELDLYEVPYYRQTEVKAKTVICFPKLRKLTVGSHSDISNRSFQLDCPQLQSVAISGDLKSSLKDGPGTSLYEILVTTASITHVSFSSDHSHRKKTTDFEVCLKRLFDKFRYIKELTFQTEQHVALKYLVDKLPESIPKLIIEYKYTRGSDRYLLNKIFQIRFNGGSISEAKEDDDLTCELCFREHLTPWEEPKFDDFKITIHGRENLRALVALRGKK